MGINGVQVAAACDIGGFVGADLVHCVQLAYALSNWNPSMQSNDHYGLFQIKKSAHPDLFSQYKWDNPADNARMANVLYQKDAGLLSSEGGWGAWHGAYDTTKFNNAKPGAERDVAEYRKQVSAGKSAESILGASRTDGAKTVEGGVGGKVVTALTSLNPLAGLFQGNLWLRVAEVAAGAILLMIGINQMIKDSTGRDVLKSVAGTGAKAAKVAALA